MGLFRLLRGLFTLTAAGIFFFLLFFGFQFFVGGWAVQYTVEFWVSYLKHTAVHIPFLPCGLAGIFLAEIAVPLAIATWILSFCL